MFLLICPKCGSKIEIPEKCLKGSLPFGTRRCVACGHELPSALLYSLCEFCSDTGEKKGWGAFRFPDGAFTTSISIDFDGAPRPSPPEGCTHSRK